MASNVKYVKATLKSGTVSCKFISIKAWTKECIENFRKTPDDKGALFYRKKDEVIILCRTAVDLKTFFRNNKHVTR